MAIDNKEVYEDDGSFKRLERESIDMSDEEMIRTLQNRMNMIPTARVTNTNTSRDNIHGGEEPDEEWSNAEWEAYENQEAEEIAEYERHLRDALENPEPNNLEEE